MKCLHLLPMSTLSGAEKLALILTKNLEKYHPIVVCGGEELREAFEKNNIESYCINFKDNNPLKNAKELKDIIVKNKIKIVHAHDNTASITSYIAKVIYKLDITVISHIHNCYPWLVGKTKTKVIDKFFRRRYDHNIACGKLVFDHYINNTNYINENNTTILSNAIDIEEINKLSSTNTNEIYEKFDIPKDKKVIGFIGRLSEQKGIIPFVRELANYKDDFKDSIFLLVGDGEQGSEVKKLLKELNLEENFILTGYQKNIYDFYPIIDIFFLPSLYEGLPMVILEAMSFNKAVVSMDVGSINEVIQNNINGIVVEQGKTKEFITKLIELKDNENLIKDYGKKAQDTIKERYNIKKYSVEIEHLYDRFIC